MKGHHFDATVLRNIAILRALPGLGDMLCMVPALRSVRAALPHARISLVGLPQSTFLLERYPDYVDEVIDFPGFPGLPEVEPRLADLPDFFKQMQERDFDLMLQMHGSGHITNPLAMLFNARYCAGFHVPGGYCPDSNRFFPWVETQPEVHRYLQLVTNLGFPPQGEELEFPLQDSDRDALMALPEACNLRQGGYVCIHPGASVEARRWPASRFIEVADRLAREGLRIVITGSEAERPLATEIAQSMQRPPINLAGCTHLGALAALLANARLLICNDTGVSHLAAAIGTPSIVIFTTTAPARWAPLNRRRHRVVENSEIRVSCSQTGSLQLRCSRQAKPQVVLDEARNLLQTEVQRAAAG